MTKKVKTARKIKSRAKTSQKTSFSDDMNKRREMRREAGNGYMTVKGFKQALRQGDIEPDDLFYRYSATGDLKRDIAISGHAAYLEEIFAQQRSHDFVSSHYDELCDMLDIDVSREDAWDVLIGELQAANFTSEQEKQIVKMLADDGILANTEKAPQQAGYNFKGFGRWGVVCDRSPNPEYVGNGYLVIFDGTEVPMTDFYIDDGNYVVPEHVYVSISIDDPDYDELLDFIEEYDE